MERFIIAITRTCGSGATTVSKMLADEYGIDLYDRKLLRLASEDSGINEALFGKADEKVKKTLLYHASRKVYNGELIPPESDDFASDNNLFNYQAKVLKELANQESYIVIGRGADYILRDNPNMISVFLTADLETRITHEMERMCCDRKEATKYIHKMDKFRSEYYTYHTGKKWKDTENYDLTLNTAKLGYDKCVELIKNYVSYRTEK
ncbi:MAG: cytidylate kinase-like family protein [Lachnospiraceae bacterium]|nr:cytidylate kinase-like family protein [Lachnospiraceae bacterium]